MHVRAPGLIEVTAREQGSPVTYLAVGGSLYREERPVDPRVVARLDRVRAELKELSSAERALGKELAADHALRADVELLTSHRTLRSVDVTGLDPAALEKLRALERILLRRDSQADEQKRIEAELGVRSFRGIGAAAGTSVSLARREWWNDTTYFVAEGASGELPSRILRYSARGGIEQVYQVDSMIRGLAAAGEAGEPPFWRIGPHAIPILKEYARGDRRASDAPDTVRAKAALILGEMSIPDAVPELLGILSRCEAGRAPLAPRERIERALRWVGQEGAPHFRAGLESESALVREASAGFFTAHPAAEARERLATLLDDASPRVRDGAARALGTLGDERAVDRLVEIVSRGDEDEAPGAARLLAVSGVEKARQYLREALADTRLAPLVLDAALRSNDPGIVIPLARLVSAAEPPSKEIWRGLSRWGFRGDPDALRAMVLGSRRPDVDAGLRQKLEMEMTELPEHLREKLPAMAAALRRGLPADAPAWQPEALDAFIACRALGIEIIERLPGEHITWLVEERMNPSKDDRPLAIFVYPRGDSNGAFFTGTQMIRDLVTRGYRVMYYEVESDIELVQAVNHAVGFGTEREQKARLVLFGGHGTQTTMRFGRDGHPTDPNRSFLDTGDMELLLRGRVGEALEENGTVLAESCSGGAGGAGASNVVNFLRKLFPQAAPNQVWGVIEPYSESILIFDEENRIIGVTYDVPGYQAWHRVEEAEGRLREGVRPEGVPAVRDAVT